MKFSQNRNGNAAWRWIIALAAIFAVAIFLYATREKVYAQLSAWDLVPKAEAFTELYFQNAAQLPTATVAGQSISFAFTIHNVEGVTTVYPYDVYFEYPDGSQVDFVEGSVTLANDATTTIPVAHKFLASNLTGKVVVDLPSQNNQSIDFLLPDTN